MIKSIRALSLVILAGAWAVTWGQPGNSDYDPYDSSSYDSYDPDDRDGDRDYYRDDHRTSDDPPDRVARLSYTSGSVSFEPAGTDDWVEAMLNRPITIGDRLWVEDNGRAELDIGSAAIRLAGGTDFSFLDLNDDVVQIELTEGVISVHLRDLEPDEVFEIDAPNVAYTLLRPGDYRLETNEAGDTTIVYVRDGRGEVSGGGQVFTVRSDQRAAFIGADDELESFIEEAGGDDAFDRWTRDRDSRVERAASQRYVPRGVIGSADLDDYGDWRQSAEYGPVWYPRAVVADWAPYRYGHWTWISPWGWTWVDDAPWGFAPFHYGRWAQVGGTWGWCPGPVTPAVQVRRAVYAPALVAWVGGSHFGVGISIGGGRSDGVGWFPLAPREVYVPPYRATSAYVTNVNITNTTVNNTTVVNVYNNRARVNDVQYANRRAFTATSRNVLTSAQPVGRNQVQVDRAEVTRAPVTTQVAAVPQQKSVVGAGTPTTRRPRLAMMQRGVVGRRTPPPAPVAFAKEQKAIEANGGQPLARNEKQQLQPQARPARVRVVRPGAQAVPIESVAQRGVPPRGRSAIRRQPSVPTPTPTPAPQTATPAPSAPVRPTPPDRPPVIRQPRSQQIQQRQQEQQQRLQQQQEAQRRQLEQRQQQKVQRTAPRPAPSNGPATAQPQAQPNAQQQQAEARQAIERQKLQQQQDLRRKRLEAQQQREREKVQQQEERKKNPRPRRSR